MIIEEKAVLKKSNKSVGNALKWSFSAELAAKLMLPISNMVLARLLTPEMFGVVATVTMITSFADIFTDAGFQKYIVQHEFVDDDEKYASTNVAFWTNLILSFFIWGIIVIFRHPLAEIVGNKGLGNVIAYSSVTIPITAFTSLQMALFRRDLDFRKLFYVRLVGVSVPIVVTIPLAFFMRDYKAMIIGTVIKNLIDLIILMWGCIWKPSFNYNFKLLKDMLSFSIWSLIESITIWLTSYLGIFIVGTLFSPYYVGLYKTSMTTVNQIVSLMTSATTPVLFASLSRLQNNDEMFCKTFFKFQRMVAVLVVPMGIGILLYKDLITRIMLGSQWMEASEFIGLWGLLSSITIVWAHYCSEIYRAKGKPKVSVLAQVLQLIVLIPTLYISSKYGFRIFYISRSMVRVALIFITFVLCAIFTNVSPVKMITNVFPHIMSGLVMGGVALGLQQMGQSTLWQFCSIAICAIVYFVVLLSFPKLRKEIFEIEIVRKLIYKTKLRNKGK